MNNSNKTGKFLDAINKYAEQQKAEIYHEVEEFRKQEFEKATQEGLKDAYTLIQKEIFQRKTAIASDIAKQEQASRKQLFTYRNQLVDKVFDEAENRLKEFSLTEKYIKKLEQSAEKIAQIFCNKSCIVYLAEKDFNKPEIVNIIKSKIKNCEIKIDSKIALGGIKAYCEDEGIIADDTFDSKLADQRDWFIQNSNLKVV